MCRALYIARMDGDDKSRPERFEKQIAYLEQHPDLMLISCRTHMFGEEDLISQIQGTPKQLQAMMLIRPRIGASRLYDAQGADCTGRVSDMMNLIVPPRIITLRRELQKNSESE